MICLFFSTQINGSEKKNLLYDEKSDFHPVTYYFNSAFDVYQNSGYFSQDNYRQKHETLFKRVFSINHSIKKDGGWYRFFSDEFASNRIFPNVGLHLIGSGYDSREIDEYYSSKDYNYSMIFTILTVYAGHLGNEALELSNKNVTSHDNIADLYFYDVFAILLFQNDKVVRFFRDDLVMRRWSYQPFVDFKDFDINNAGLNYIFRPDIFKSKTKPFAFIGMQNLVGLSYEFSKKKYITFGLGIAFTDPLEQKGYLAGAIFYDSDDLLSTSLIVNGTEDYKVRLNIYPNCFSEKFKLGAMIGLKRDYEKVVGFNYILPLGVGVKL